MIPEIAIIGHPNEGKSSVLSTLAEDDSVRISPFPGETTRCRTFPVIIDGREVLTFTDTPGFQSPAKLLAELRRSSGNSVQRLRHLTTITGSEPELQDDHELLQPIARGAGIIYVVDGSRPIRNVDRAEMEILRLIGRPRMAVINSKLHDEQFLDSWKDELAKHFNSCRIFNAQRATYGERIALLEALKAIDQDWQHAINEVIQAFEKDWASRTRTCSEIICSLLKDTLSLQLTAKLTKSGEDSDLARQLVEDYTRKVADCEKRAHQKIRSLFKHNIFNYQLPPYSILHDDLFSERTWQLLGLTKRQFLLLGAIGGVAVGAGVDVAALGHGLGLFTAIGGVAGAVGALAGRKHLKADASLLGVRIAGPQLQIGPAQTISLLFVLLNRAFLFYQHIINWAHGRRDYSDTSEQDKSIEAPGFTQEWSSQYLKICNRYFKSIQNDTLKEHHSAETEMQDVIFAHLMEISRDE